MARRPRPWLARPRRAAISSHAAGFDREGASAVVMSTAEFGDYIKKEIDKWERVVKEAKMAAP